MATHKQPGCVAADPHSNHSVFQIHSIVESTVSLNFQ